MDKTKIKDIPVQGTEVITEKKNQTKSASYALKAITVHFDTLSVNNLLTLEEFNAIQTILKRAKTEYIKREYGL